MKKENRRLTILLAVIGVIIVSFLTFVTIGMINMDTELSLVQAYELPEFMKVSEIVGSETGDWALAVDGEIAAGKNMEDAEVRPTASTAKMILALAVMREKPFSLGESGETITISRENYNRYVWYINNGGSNTRVAVGEEISEYDALASVMLPSSNNMADTLAEWAFGSLENYREYATEMLRELGIFNTTIGADASGFSETTTSTTEDLAKIGTEVLKNPVLAEIVGRTSYEVPVAGKIENTNKLLGQNGIIGVKTGYIGAPSGYCLVSGYREGEHIITLARLGATTRQLSFDESLAIVAQAQEKLREEKVISAGEMVGKYESWWTGEVEIHATEDLSLLGWDEAEKEVLLSMEKNSGRLTIKIAGTEYAVPVSAEEYNLAPSFFEKFLYLFGWRKENVKVSEDADVSESVEEVEVVEEVTKPEEKFVSITGAPTTNCSMRYGYLMLINPNFKVDTSFIAARKTELISVSKTYGIPELKASNGDNLMDAEAAAHLNEMVKAYEAENPGHTMGTRSCFRSVGTKCGRLCAATGESDHHTGLTCDLIDQAYGSSLDTDYYNNHPEWQWLKANSYKYGFIDRFPEAWAGGSMSEPLNVDTNGSTGLFETWHYRYVGVTAATEIATGKYNDSKYDSLEHYLKARGLVADLKNAICE